MLRHGESNQADVSSPKPRALTSLPTERWCTPSGYSLITKQQQMLKSSMHTGPSYSKSSGAHPPCTGPTTVGPTVANVERCCGIGLHPYISTITTGSLRNLKKPPQPMLSVWWFALHACCGFITRLLRFKPWLMWVLGVGSWGWGGNCEHTKQNQQRTVVR
jgi:hypothetical protein